MVDIRAALAMLVIAFILGAVAEWYFYHGSAKPTQPTVVTIIKERPAKDNPVTAVLIQPDGTEVPITGGKVIIDTQPIMTASVSKISEDGHVRVWGSASHSIDNGVERLATQVSESHDPYPTLLDNITTAAVGAITVLALLFATNHIQ